jgi:hypothetical protein
MRGKKISGTRHGRQLPKPRATRNRPTSARESARTTHHTCAPTRHARPMPVESASTRAVQGLTRTRGDDHSLAELARRQHGVVARRQLVEAGWSGEEIDWRIRNGRLHQLHRLCPGVYAVGHRVIPREGRWMAAVLASGPDAILTHWSAAALWRIRPNSRARIDVTVPHRSRSSDLIRRHISHVPDDERTLKEGIPATSVPRTIFDLAATEPEDVVESLLREAEFLELWDRLSLRDLVERYPRKRGVRKVQVALKRLEEDPPGRRRRGLEERLAPSSATTTCPYPALTTGSPWVQSAIRSTATGRARTRSSSSTAGRVTAPAPPSAKTARETERSASPVTPSPGSLGLNWMTNPRRSLRVYGCCWGLRNKKKKKRSAPPHWKLKLRELLRDRGGGDQDQR